jgi:hypothetical protein
MPYLGTVQLLRRHVCIELLRCRLRIIGRSSRSSRQLDFVVWLRCVKLLFVRLFGVSTQCPLSVSSSGKQVDSKDGCNDYAHAKTDRDADGSFVSIAVINR